MPDVLWCYTDSEGLEFCTHVDVPGTPLEVHPVSLRWIYDMVSIFTNAIYFVAPAPEDAPPPLVIDAFIRGTEEDPKF